LNKTRARSPEKKAEQFKKIIEEGRRLFLAVGSEGFSIRGIARKLEMSQGNLYNYIQSKRELWFAVIREDFEIFTKGMIELREKSEGTNFELLEETGKYYLEFAKQDLERYKMMFMPAPSSDNIGPIEANYHPESFDILLNIVQKAIEEGELIDTNPVKFTIYIWGVLHGNIILSTPEALFPKQYAKKLSYIEDHFNYISEQIAILLNQYKKK